MLACGRFLSCVSVYRPHIVVGNIDGIEGAAYDFGHCSAPADLMRSYEYEQEKYLSYSVPESG